MRPKTSQSLRGQPCTLCDIIKLGYFPHIRMLVTKGINLEATDTSKRTPLILCAFMTPEDWGVTTAMTLIENNATVGARDIYGRNVLHYACIYEREKLIQVIIRAIDFDINQTDKQGNTALHYAAMSGNVQITRLLVSVFQKYRINADKINLNGRSAAEEATIAGYLECASFIELELSSSRFERDVIHTPDSCISSSNFSASQTRYLLGERKIMRPKSAVFLARNVSTSSIKSAYGGRSSGRGSSTCFKIGSSLRKSQNPFHTFGYRKDGEVIHCAQSGDFRNTPEYVCKITSLPYDKHFREVLDLTNQNRSYLMDAGTINQTQKIDSDWRQELAHLFKVYEYQCSPSWRVCKLWDKSAPSQTTSPGPEDDDKVKKGKSHHLLSKSAQGKDISPDLRKKGSSLRGRKLLNGKISAGATVDGSLDTSSDSMNSLASNRRRGPERDTILGSRLNTLSTKQRVRSSRGARSRPQSPTSSTPLQEPTLSVTSDSIQHINKTSPQTKTDTKQDTPSSTPLSTFTEALITTSSKAQKLKEPAPENLSQKGEKSNEKAALGSSQSTDSVISSLPKTLVDNKIHQTIQNALDPVGKKNSNSVISSNLLVDNVALLLPKILVVAEVNEAVEMTDSSGSHQPQVDTSKLWVHNPYEDDNDDAEEKDVDENC